MQTEQVVKTRANSASEEISIKQFVIKTNAWLIFLKSKILIILLLCILGAFIGFLAAILIKPIYKADLSFVIQDEKPGGIGIASGLASQFGFDLGGSADGEFSGDNLIELLKSRSMVEKTLLTKVYYKGKLQTLAEIYISFNHLRESWKNDSSLVGLSFENKIDPKKFSLKQDSLLGDFYSRLLKYSLIVDKLDKKLSIINVSTKSKDELFSKIFVETLVKTVSEFYIVTKTRKEAQNVAILQHQTDSVKKQLNSAIGGVAESIDNNPNANTVFQVLKAPSQRRQFDVQVNTAILIELVKNLELSKISLRKETPLIQVIDTPILPLERISLGKLRGTIYGLIFGLILIITYLSLHRIFIQIMLSDDNL